MNPDMLNLLTKSFWETCYMVFASTALSTLIGIPLRRYFNCYPQGAHPTQPSGEQHSRRYR